MQFAAELVLAALGTESEDESQYLYALAGAMEIVEGLSDLKRLRRMVQKALSK